MKVVTGAGETDADLAARFTSEVEPLRDMLARGARRMTRSDADAEDLLQDALMHAYAGFQTFAGGTNFKAWLFRILYNRWSAATGRSSVGPPRSASMTSPKSRCGAESGT